MTRLIKTPQTAGFSLIELLIAISLGTLVIAATTALFSSASQSTKQQDALATVQENLNFTVKSLRENIRIAGAYDVNAADGSINDATTIFSGNAIIDVTDSGDSTSDSITYLLHSNSQSLETCNGVNIGSSGDEEIAINQYFISGTSLRCQYTLQAPDGTVLGTSSSELVEDVENMQILIGEDTDNDRSVNRYVRGDQITDSANIISIRIALLFRSPDSIANTTGTTNFTLLDQSVTSPASGHDGRIRRVGILTVALRNKAP